jgi:tyrosine-protein kinase Etk/Wzc
MIMTEDDAHYSVLSSAPIIPFPVLWRRKRFVMRIGIYFALLSFLFFLLTPGFWVTKYEGLIRVEPELSTTGEQTVIDAEMAVIQSWDMVAQVVRKLDRLVIVRPNRSVFFMHVQYYVDYVTSLFSGKTTPNFSLYQPAVGLDYFDIPGYTPTRRDDVFLLEVGQNNSYILYDPDGKRMIDGKVGDNTTGSFVSHDGHAYEVRTRITALNNVKPGDSFKIIPQNYQNYVTGLSLNNLYVDRTGYKNSSGIMVVDFKDWDPEFARQFLQKLVDVYTSQAYDRSSIGKSEGLQKLKEQAVQLRKNVDDAENALAEFKMQHNALTPDREEDTNYKRSLEIEDQLREEDARYHDLGFSLTAQHPTMVALHNRIVFLRKELERLHTNMQEMPQIERKYHELERTVAIAQQILQENSALQSQLEVQVKTITGYAHLISLSLYQKYSDVSNGILAIMIGFGVGVLAACLWLIRISLPAFAHIRYPEDLASAAALPVVTVLPFKSSWMRWIWYYHYDRSTVATTFQWERRAIDEIERLEQGISLLLPSATNKILCFTSIDGHYGASFCARELAKASALEHRTLLIDANIMDPTVSEEFQCSEIPGLTDILVGKVRVAESIQPTTVTNLFVLPAGRPTPNFRLLSDTQHMSKVLADTSASFDRIIIEFPALTPSVCSEGLLSLMHAVFVVVNRNTMLQELKKTLEECKISTHPTAFFILNKGSKTL